MAQDWSGDANSVYKIIGASNHSNEKRVNRKLDGFNTPKARNPPLL